MFLPYAEDCRDSALYTSASSSNKDGDERKDAHDNVDIDAMAPPSQPPRAYTKEDIEGLSLQIAASDMFETPESLRRHPSHILVACTSTKELYTPCVCLEAVHAGQCARSVSKRSTTRTGSSRRRRIFCFCVPICMIVIGVVIGIVFLTLHLNKKKKAAHSEETPSNYAQSNCAQSNYENAITGLDNSYNGFIHAKESLCNAMRPYFGSRLCLNPGVLEQAVAEKGSLLD